LLLLLARWCNERVRRSRKVQDVVEKVLSVDESKSVIRAIDSAAIAGGPAIFLRNAA
jgi:hypothetical protein